MRGLLLISLLVFAVPTQDRVQQEFEQLRYRLLLEAGQRHLDLGVWCRDRGLIGQGTAEFLKAVETSGGRHPGANAALRAMRNFEDAFWKKSRARRPANSTIRSYDKRARAARKIDTAARLDLANWAYRKDLREESEREHRLLLEDLEGPVEFDKRGRIVLEGGTIPEDASIAFRDELIGIGGRQYLRDEILAHLPAWDSVQEIDSERLRVRAPVGFADLDDYLALGQALLPLLEETLAARATRKLDLLLFPTRAEFEGFIESIGSGERRFAAGLAVSRLFVALVCLEGSSGIEQRGIALHELTHLYSYDVTRAIMPSWYAEGVAESFGGQGTFRWEAGELEVGGPMAPHRLQAFCDPATRMSLEEVLRSDAFQLLRQDRAKGIRFYAHAWALVRFLRTGAGDAVAGRFAEWERRCQGAALGAVAGDLRKENTSPASALFQEMFAADLPRLAEEFAAFLETFCQG